MDDRAGMHKFGRDRRLNGRRAFAAVFEAKVRSGRGPLLVYGRPNGLPHGRLGLSVSRRVGSAVARNRIKRRVREAWRLMQGELPSGYDWVAVIRPHEVMTVETYQTLLKEAAERVDAKWSGQGGF